MNKTINIIFVLCGFFTPMFLQSQNIIPTPKKTILKNHSFSLDQRLSITKNNVSEDNAKLLEDVLKNKTSISNKERHQSFIHLEKIASVKVLQEKLKEHNLRRNDDLGSEGYILNVDENRIEIFALEEAGIFYGIQTLRQLFNAHKQAQKIPCMLVYDKPDIAIRAWQDDISRGPIPTLETLKQEIEIMSSFKLNHFTLYTEHIFKLDKHPTIAPREGITKTDLRELSHFAKKHHVTLIGNYQSFGHMNKTLSNPKYAHLAETADVISPAMEASYDFLSDVYEEVVPQYDGTYFNINCDETFGLGEGKSKAIIDSIGMAGLYAYHINRLDKILKKYNKKILMWGDVATAYPEIIPALPKDMTVMAWGYSGDESFDHAIEPIVKHQLDFWVAPGISCWSNVYPDLKTTEINVYNFIRDGYKFNTKGVLNTSWDDDALNFFNNNWHGFIWGAELSWHAPPNLPKRQSEADRSKRYQNFNIAFDQQFYGLSNKESITALMHQFSLLHHAVGQNILKNESFFEGVFPMHANYVKANSRENNSLILNQLDAMLAQLKNLKHHATENKKTIDYLIYSVNQARCTIKKNLFRIHLHEYLYQETTSTEIELRSAKKKLVNDLKNLKADYIQLWNKENRAHWFAQNIEKFDVLISSVVKVGNLVLIEPINGQETKATKISMRTVFTGPPIYYALDADTLTTSSTLYTKPFSLKEAALIQAMSYDEENPETVQKTNLLYHKGVGRLHHLASTPSSYHPSYYGGGKEALLDGKLGKKENLWSGKWQGYQGQDIELELVFNPNETLQSFSMGFFQHTDLWVIFPKQVDLYIKDNLDDDYQLYRTIRGTISPKEKGDLKQNYVTNLDHLKTKYMKIIAQYYGKLPEWHKAGSNNYESMIFADEIIIK